MPALSSAVVRAGAIVESGSHAELMARPDGAYATLVRLQAIVHQKHQEVRLKRHVFCTHSTAIAFGAWLENSCLMRYLAGYEEAVDLQA